MLTVCFVYLFTFFSPRATLYVGKYSTSLYASPSLVHDGVTVVVSAYLHVFRHLGKTQVLHKNLRHVYWKNKCVFC